MAVTKPRKLASWFKNVEEADDVHLSLGVRVIIAGVLCCLWVAWGRLSKLFDYLSYATFVTAPFFARIAISAAS